MKTTASQTCWDGVRMLMVKMESISLGIAHRRGTWNICGCMYYHSVMITRVPRSLRNLSE